MIHPDLGPGTASGSHPISAGPLGAFRIVFGLLALANLAFLAVDLDYWYTDPGLLRGRRGLEVAGPFRYSPLLNWFQDPTRSGSPSA